MNTQNIAKKGLAWLRAIRLHFYPMTWIAYSVGALSVASHGIALDSFWFGYGVLFFLEVAAVLCNEYFDFNSDRINQNHGPFNGGSRVLVEGQLTFAEMRVGIGIALSLMLLFAGLLLTTTATPVPSGIFLSLVMTVLALGYTMPPLKFSHRGLGELVVALTHSLGVILCGHIFQGGAWRDPLPWLIGLPLLLAVFAAITLSGIPDYQADRQAKKNTLVVKLGPSRVIPWVAGFVSLATGLVLVWQGSDLLDSAFAGASYFVVPHALLLLVMLWRHRRRQPSRINALMVASLTYILWFVVIPLYHLLG